jgi:hypothetical protein
MVEFANLRDIASGDYWSKEMYVWTTQASAQLAPIFEREGWTWSGKPVTYSDIESKLVILAHEVASEMLKTGKQVCSISSGRLMVEGRLIDTDRQDAGFTVFLHYSV